MKQKTCAEIIAEAEKKIKNSPVINAACEYSDSLKKPVTIYGFGKINLIEAFQAGAEWQANQSPWISVEERLPDENTGVLFLVEWGKNHYGYFVGVYYGNGCWESERFIFLPDSKIGKVTHWMPLPKKGGEK